MLCPAFFPFIIMRELLGRASIRPEAEGRDSRLDIALLV